MKIYTKLVREQGMIYVYRRSDTPAILEITSVALDFIGDGVVFREGLVASCPNELTYGVRTHRLIGFFNFEERIAKHCSIVYQAFRLEDGRPNVGYGHGCVGDSQSGIRCACGLYETSRKHGLGKLFVDRKSVV